MKKLFSFLLLLSLSGPRWQTARAGVARRRCAKGRYRVASGTDYYFPELKRCLSIVYILQTTVHNT